MLELFMIISVVLLYAILFLLRGHLLSIRERYILEFFEKINFTEVHHLIDVIASTRHPSGVIISPEFEQPLRNLMRRYQVTAKKFHENEMVVLIVSHKPLKLYVLELIWFLTFQHRRHKRRRQAEELAMRQQIVRSIQFLLSSQRIRHLLVKSHRKLKVLVRNVHELEEVLKLPLEPLDFQGHLISIHPFSSDFLVVEKRDARVLGAV